MVSYYGFDLSSLAEGPTGMMLVGVLLTLVSLAMWLEFGPVTIVAGGAKMHLKLQQLEERIDCLEAQLRDVSLWTGRTQLASTLSTPISRDGMDFGTQPPGVFRTPSPSPPRAVTPEEVASPLSVHHMASPHGPVNGHPDDHKGSSVSDSPQWDTPHQRAPAHDTREERSPLMAFRRARARQAISKPVDDDMRENMALSAPSGGGAPTWPDGIADHPDDIALTEKSTAVEQEAVTRRTTASPSSPSSILGYDKIEEHKQRIAQAQLRIRNWARDSASRDLERSK